MLNVLFRKTTTSKRDCFAVNKIICKQNVRSVSWQVVPSRLFPDSVQLACHSRTDTCFCVHARARTCMCVCARACVCVCVCARARMHVCDVLDKSRPCNHKTHCNVADADLWRRAARPSVQSRQSKTSTRSPIFNYGACLIFNAQGAERSHMDRHRAPFQVCV